VCTWRQGRDCAWQQVDGRRAAGHRRQRHLPSRMGNYRAQQDQEGRTTDNLRPTAGGSHLIYLGYLRQRRMYMFSPARPRSFVCLSVCKITQKRVHGFR